MKYFNKNTWVYFNGTFVKADRTEVDLFGQSLHYGYSAIEGIRAYNTHNGTRIFRAEQHYDRLRRSCELVGIPFPWKTNPLVEHTYELLGKNNLRSAYIRPLVTTGQNMYLTPAKDSNIVITAWEWGPFLGTDLIRVSISPYQRPNPNSLPAEAKISGQYVASILATNEATQRGFDEPSCWTVTDTLRKRPATICSLKRMRYCIRRHLALFFRVSPGKPCWRLPMY